MLHHATGYCANSCTMQQLANSLFLAFSSLGGIQEEGIRLQIGKHFVLYAEYCDFCSTEHWIQFSGGVLDGFLEFCLPGLFCRSPSFDKQERDKI